MSASPHCVCVIRGLITIIVLMSACASCRGCGCTREQVTEVNSEFVTLDVPAEAKLALPPPPAAPQMQPATQASSNNQRIEIIGKANAPAEQPATNVIEDLSKSGPPPVPPSTFKADDLTMRLREKMAEAYGGDVKRVPEATIYLSNGTIDEFIDFYEQRGYKVSRITVPVKRILQPVLREKPELAEKIKLDDYGDTVIHQVMVEGTGISAADKYVDPDTYKVVDRLFVTEMPLK